MFEYIWACMRHARATTKNNLLAGVEQVTFVGDKSPLQYLSNTYTARQHGEILADTHKLYH